MTFNLQTNGGSGELTLAQMQASYGTQEIEMISIQTDSGWNGFDGFIDGLVITLLNGNVGVVDLGQADADLALTKTWTRLAPKSAASSTTPWT